MHTPIVGPECCLLLDTDQTDVALVSAQFGEQTMVNLPVKCC